ncbi:hypothetical protein [Hymenobacter mucosus]|uniref:DUF2314 domain-containing protein n=1 Tax=Hymenobacter mucosus TaxID=1411120 RepID=A0A238WV59_9BACT|nr:hypothetical protein [Hymenobacter mucosus]SNR50445.1 hypothetical protein SAMN06269173_103142 [Hymenobacter mucosus]
MKQQGTKEVPPGPVENLFGHSIVSSWKGDYLQAPAILLTAMRYSLPLLLAATLSGAALAPQSQSSAALSALVLQLAQPRKALPDLPVKEARRTLSQARQRYQRGLPAGTNLYLTARVLNEVAAPEPVLVAVDTWQGNHISGRIVRTTADGRATTATDPVDFDEPAVLDWLVLRPDGAEEGNYLGKFLELEDRLASLED